MCLCPTLWPLCQASGSTLSPHGGGGSARSRHRYSHPSVITTYQRHAPIGATVALVATRQRAQAVARAWEQEHAVVDALECQLVAPVDSLGGVLIADFHSVHDIAAAATLLLLDASVIVSLHAQATRLPNIRALVSVVRNLDSA